MKKILCAFAALMILLSAAVCGVSESLFVDNRETDKIYPERLNLRGRRNRLHGNRIPDSGKRNHRALW